MMTKRQLVHEWFNHPFKKEFPNIKMIIEEVDDSIIGVNGLETTDDLYFRLVYVVSDEVEIGNLYRIKEDDVNPALTVLNHINHFENKVYMEYMEFTTIYGEQV